MRTFNCLLVALTLGTAPLVAANPDWRDPALWRSSIPHSIGFFDAHAWDEASGSYASDINVDGTRRDETRHLIALSRMVYGLAHGSIVNRGYLERAQRAADFILQKMVRRDAIGPYFLSAVDAQGHIIPNDLLKIDDRGEVDADKSRLLVNEQAYGLNGLVALYQIAPSRKLLRKIRELYDSFYSRFHDKDHLGFYDEVPLGRLEVVPTKSYNSTVYVATSFLLELAAADPRRRQEYEATIGELANLVVKHFPDPRTGWIIENFTRDWKPDWRAWQKQGEFTVGVTGHNFQAAWFLMRAEAIVPSLRDALAYRTTANALLTSMLSKPVIDWEKGGIFDAFKRETNETMWNSNKAWWQQAEAIMALTLADLTGVLRSERATQARDQALRFYFEHFVDKKAGGEFNVVDRDGNPIKDTIKGELGKSSYHVIEMATKMLEYIDYCAYQMTH